MVPRLFVWGSKDLGRSWSCDMKKITLFAFNLGADYMSRASPANRADLILSRLILA